MAGSADQNDLGKSLRRKKEGVKEENKASWREDKQKEGAFERALLECPDSEPI